MEHTPMAGNIGFKAIIVDDLVSYSNIFPRLDGLPVDHVVGSVVYEALRSVNSNFDLSQTPIEFPCSRIEVYPPG
jgi:hypothetical protein